MNYNNYETSYTSYNAGGGGGGGGGFMPDGTQNTPSKARDNGRDTLRPVTIKQILDAQPDLPSDDFKIDENKVSQLTFIGQIRNIAAQTTNTTYRLDDGTGTIEVKQWNDAEATESNPTKSRLVEGAYCRAWGKLKSFHDRRHVNATIIRPIDDMNEIQYHMLEATAVHLYLIRGPIGAANDAGGAAATHGATGHADGGATAQNSNIAHCSRIAKQVYECLRSEPQGNEGLHCQTIAAKLGLENGQVAAAGDELIQAGAIYTTMDDLTWALLDSVS